MQVEPLEAKSDTNPCKVSRNFSLFHGMCRLQKRTDDYFI